MSYLLVPQAASANAAELWLGVVGDEATSDLSLAIGSDRIIAVPDRWTTYEIDGVALVRSQILPIAGLAADRRLPVQLSAGRGEVAAATIVTLPDQLPTLGRPPLVCLLGSCFALLSDRGGSAGAAYVGLPGGARPHLKFLCGDQVYLDTPPGRFLLAAFGERDLREILLARYVETWTQISGAGGFGRLLRDGATYFGSDDHEFWNNAPDKTPLVRNTYWWPIGDEGRSWLKAAQELYRLFQTSTRNFSFAVGQLSFMVLDTRIGRTADRRQFVAPDELTALETWIARLPGPGVLVLGQPIFHPPAGPLGRFFDWGLPDFAQYAELVRILQTSRHDLLVLTGDVHYGRVSWCHLPSSAVLTEVIASPFALVSGFAGGRWAPPPGRFPAVALPGSVQLKVEYDESYQVSKNHFATLEFSADASRVRALVKAWPIPEAGVRPNPERTFALRLT